MKTLNCWELEMFSSDRRSYYNGYEPCLIPYQLHIDSHQAHLQAQIFSCEDAAHQALMSVCLSVFVCPMLKFYLFTAIYNISKVTKGYPWLPKVTQGYSRCPKVTFGYQTFSFYSREFRTLVIGPTFKSWFLLP